MLRARALRARVGEAEGKGAAPPGGDWRSGPTAVSLIEREAEECGLEPTAYLPADFREVRANFVAPDGPGCPPPLSSTTRSFNEAVRRVAAPPLSSVPRRRSSRRLPLYEDIYGPLAA